LDYFLAHTTISLINHQQIQQKMKNQKAKLVPVPLDRISRSLSLWIRAAKRLKAAGLMKKSAKGLPQLFIRAS